MERTPLRGTLSKNVAPESKLRGTLAGKTSEEEKLASTPDASIETKTVGRTMTKEELPNVEALSRCMGMTFIQRDGGSTATLQRISAVGSGSFPRVTVGLHRSDGARVSISRETFINALTTEGGAWRLLEK